MTTKWLSTIEACQTLGISQSTLRRRIDKGEIESKLEDSRRLVLVTIDNHTVTTSTKEAFVQQLQKENDDLNQQIMYLKEQTQEKDKQIESLQKQLAETQKDVAEASHRHDTVVMQLTKIVEYQQQPFWRKLFQRKQLPPPLDETIMEAGIGGQEKANGK